MPKQITRLLIAFVLFISLFLVIKHFLTPKSFGKYGHYRADALDDNAAHEINYADINACAECHNDIDTLKNKGFHKSINCQTCHGPGSKHISDPDKVVLVKPATRAFCGKCHSKLAGRSSDVIHQVDTTKHNVKKKCTLCHNPHSPLMQKASTVAGDKIDEAAVCITCHAPINMIKIKGKHKGLNCQICHGTGKEHIANPSKSNITKPSKREFCGGCHGTGKTSSGIKQIDLKEHNTEGKCVECHIAHNPLDFK